MNDNNIIENIEKKVNLETFLSETNIKENSGVSIKIGKNVIKTIYEAHNCFKPISSKIIKRYDSFDDVLLNNINKGTNTLIIEAIKNNLKFIGDVPLKYFPVELRLFFQYAILSMTYKNLSNWGGDKIHGKKIIYENIIKNLGLKLYEVDTLNEFIKESITYIHSYEKPGEPHQTFLYPYHIYVQNLDYYFSSTNVVEDYRNQCLNYLNMNIYNISFKTIFTKINKILKAVNSKSIGYFIRYYINNTDDSLNFGFYLNYIKYEPSINKLSSFDRKPKNEEYDKDKKILFRTEDDALLKLTKKDVNTLHYCLKGTYIIKT